MPQDIKTGSVYNTQVPLLSDTADIVVALTNYHYGITTGIAPADGAVSAGIAGLFKSKAPLESPAFTGTIVLTQDTGISTGTHIITRTELGYLNGVASNVQTQINDLKTNPQFLGVVYSEQGNPTAIADSNATLTWAQLKTRIINTQPTTIRTWKLPDATTSAIPADNLAFEWSIINKAISSGRNITISTTGVTGHTYEGSGTINYNSSATFRTRRISSTSYVTYRIA
jgi:hypothetical protein